MSNNSLSTAALSAVPQLALIAESNLDTFELYKTYLVPRRYVVEQAVTGADALAKAIADPPDVMIVETHLPIIDGFELCALLRRDPKTRRLPIVLIAANERRPDMDRARSAGATAVLVKPCLPDTLFAELQRIQMEPPMVPDPGANRRVVNAQSRARSRRYERYATTTPPEAPPALRCPQCDVALAFEESYVGGVSSKFPEQWDRFRCPSGCGAFQYRHRTRRLRQEP